MRRHPIVCSVEGKNKASKQNIQHKITEYYVRKAEKILNRDFLSQEDKKKALELLIGKIRDSPEAERES